MAAWLAFTIAHTLHIQNPYWAAMPIWVVAQSSRGLLIERGIYRILGTLLGAAIGYAIIHLFPGANLQFLILGIVVAICSAGTHLFRGVVTYGALMTGITAAIIVLPTVFAPEASSSLAIARVACTLIGVLTVTIVTVLFTPKSPRNEFYKRARNLTAESLLFIVQRLEKGTTADMEEEEKKILIHLSDIDANARMVSAGSFEGYRRVQQVDALVSSVLSVISIGHCLKNNPSTKLQSELRSLAQWLLLEDLNKTGPPVIHWDDLELGIGIKRRMAAAIDQLIKTELLLIAHSSVTLSEKKFHYLMPHRDWQVGLGTGLSAGTVTTIAAILGLHSSWHHAELAAMGVCIFSLVLGAMPAPQKIAPHMLVGAISGVILAAFYRLGIQPHLTSELQVIASVIPFFLFAGLARANKKTMLPALDMIMCFLLAGQAGMPFTNVSDVLSALLALLMAATIVTLSYILIPRPSQKYAHKAKKSIQELIVAMTLKKRLQNEEWHAKSGREILRYLLHLQYAGLDQKIPAGLFETINLGHIIVELQNMAQQKDCHSNIKASIEEFLSSLRDQINNSSTELDMSKYLTKDTEMANIFNEALLNFEGLKRFVQS